MSCYNHYKNFNKLILSNRSFYFDFAQLAGELGRSIVKSSAKNVHWGVVVTSGELVVGELISGELVVGELISGELVSDEHTKTKTGFTTTHNFRMLLDPPTKKKIDRVAWDNYTFSVKVCLENWLAQSAETPAWSGVHLFARYNTENDLYVASLRKDGFVVIKKKIRGEYTTLATSKGELTLGKWYVLAFCVENAKLSFYIDGVLILETNDSTLSSGTSGVRFDYAAVHIRSLEIK